MIHRVALVLPLVLALGCGAAPPPAAVPPAEPSTPAAGAVEGAKATPAQDGTHAPPPPPVAPAASAATTGQGATPAPGKAAVSSKEAPLLSTITQDEVINQVGKSSDSFNRCYALGAGASKSWRAKVTVKATVSPSGNVTSCEVLNSTAKNPKVDACVVDAFKKLVFPRPQGSGATTLTFPLSFDGVEQVQ
ncbi:Hypothetical protein A7982_07545 [Minicystis rosea]|nr:Hypothetical protein A7982_07545 [Minicystis rosea]